jgi:hypothetical protein
MFIAFCDYKIVYTLYFLRIIYLINNLWLLKQSLTLFGMECIDAVQLVRLFLVSGLLPVPCYRQICSFKLEIAVSCRILQYSRRDLLTPKKKF